MKFLEVPINNLLPILEQNIKQAWYIHAFNNEKLIVILHGKSFFISLYKNETWDDMIKYGEKVNVDKKYLESFPLYI